jgi:hypothetical protein
VNRVVLSAFLTAVFACVAAAQANVVPTPVMVMPTPKAARALVGTNSLYCAGYIQYNGISTENKIIGANEEADKYNYSQNNYMYINMGSNKGVNVGDRFLVSRPRGQVNSEWSDKGNLGFYVQEVGLLEVVRVKHEVSVARVKSSCDAILLGDLVTPAEQRVSPMANPNRPPLDLFADSCNCKPWGRIIMARDLSEMPSRDFIVYVDLGAEDHVQVGDYLTIFRPLGDGNITKLWEQESISARDYGYESDTYHGGRFSNQAGRKTGPHAGGREVSTGRAKDDRVDGLRKIVGEAVVLNVKERTATVVITRTAAEIHTGDYVEMQ